MFRSIVFNLCHLHYVRSGIMNHSTKIAMTGIQPSGIPHIGNYLGPIKECIRLKADDDVSQIYVSIVDMHAMTSSIQSVSTNLDIYTMAASLIACGVCGDNVTLFQQSRVHQHASLAWILMCLCPLSRVQQLPQWKEKLHSLPHDETPNTGLLMYPVLQAADILLYSPNIVPVGEDQIIHLELARYLRTKLLSIHSKGSASLQKYFPIPELKLCRFPKIYSLRSVGKKMSKTDPDHKSRIELTDTAEEIREKVMKSVTDSDNVPISYDVEKKPAIANLVNILAAIKDITLDSAIDQSSGLNKVQFKEMLAEELIRVIGPIRERIFELLADRTVIDRYLNDGHNTASKKAAQSMEILSGYLGLNVADGTYSESLRSGDQVLRQVK